MSTTDTTVREVNLWKIGTIQKTRAALWEMIGELTVDQLNQVPAGCTNNIIWNLAHLTAAQQGLCYVRTGMPMVIDDAYFQEFRPGTKPERYINEEEIENIKHRSAVTLEQLETDYRAQAFPDTYESFSRYGVDLSSLDDAIGFLHFHEGLHTGYIMAQRRAILDHRP